MGKGVLRARDGAVGLAGGQGRFDRVQEHSGPQRCCGPRHGVYVCVRPRVCVAVCVCARARAVCVVACSRWPVSVPLSSEKPACLVRGGQRVSSPLLLPVVLESSDQATCRSEQVPPAKPLSKWDAAEEQDGWIKTTNGLWLPTQYMEKLDEAANGPPAAAGADSFPYYKCVKKNQARAGFEMDSGKAAVAAPPMVIEVIESKVNDAGVLRIRFSGGWVSERTASGIVCWQGLSEEDALALEDELEARNQAPGAAVPAPGPAPAPAPEPAPAPAPRKFKKGTVVVPDYTTPDLVRKSWMWMWRGKDWVKVFVTLDKCQLRNAAISLLRPIMKRHSQFWSG